jgi:molecular chaperone GrpE (heat shock protein)
MLEQLKRDREAAIQREQELQVQLTEVVLARQGDVKKIDFIELENAELRNNIQTLQSDVENYRRFMSNVKQILDSFGIKAPEKKPRKAKTKQDSMPPVTA